MVFPVNFIRQDGLCSCENPRCARRASHPMVSWEKEATRNPVQLQFWWGRWPMANVGIKTGRRSGIWVLEVDGEAKKTLVNWLAHFGPDSGPVTAIAGTGTRVQYYFSYEPQLEPRVRSGSVPGMRVYAEGDYVVAPPSSNSNAAYEWHTWDVPVMDAPEWIFDMLSGTPLESAITERPPSDPHLPWDDPWTNGEGLLPRWMRSRGLVDQPVTSARIVTTAGSTQTC